MSLVEFFVILVVLGLVWFLVDRYLPLPDVIKTVINVVGVLIVILMLLALFGVMEMPFRIAPGR